MRDKTFVVYMTRSYVDFEDIGQPVKKVVDHLITHKQNWPLPEYRVSHEITLSQNEFISDDYWLTNGMKEDSQKFLSLGELTQGTTSDYASLKIGLSSTMIRHRRRIDPFTAIFATVGGLFAGLVILSFVATRTILWFDVRRLNLASKLFNANLTEEEINMKRARRRPVDT